LYRKQLTPNTLYCINKIVTSQSAKGQMMTVNSWLCHQKLCTFRVSVSSCHQLYKSFKRSVSKTSAADEAFL